MHKSTFIVAIVLSADFVWLNWKDLMQRIPLSEVNYSSGRENECEHLASDKSKFNVR